jgi:hypothetical protein
MTNNGRVVIRTAQELVSGDAIEAFCEDVMVHRGPVTDTLPECGLIWILDTLSADRRLLDMSELRVVRVPPPAVEPWRRDFRGGRRPEREAGPTSYWRDVSPLG